MLRTCALVLSIITASEVTLFFPSYAKAAQAEPAKQDNTQPRKSQTNKTEVKQTVAAPSPQVTGGGGAVIFMDPVTKQIRQPTAGEIGVLMGGARPTSSVRPVAVTGPNGDVLNLGDESLVFMKATKGPDGKIAVECVTGEKSTGARAASDEAKSKALPKAVSH